MNQSNYGLTPQQIQNNLDFERAKAKREEKTNRSHTPVQWIALGKMGSGHGMNRTQVIKHENKVIAEVFESDANAHLISAAPEMLEALDKLQVEITSEFNLGKITLYQAKNLLGPIKSAITKARGGAK